MTSLMAGPEGARVIRWLEESAAVFEGVRRMLHECGQLKEAAGATQKQCERLQQHCEELREEVRRLRAETGIPGTLYSFIPPCPVAVREFLVEDRHLLSAPTG